MRRLFIALGALVMMVVLIFTWRWSAEAHVTEKCVPQGALTEVIEHPAVTHTEEVLVDPGSPAVEPVPAVSEVWANFQPNDMRAPFEGPPTYPTDSQGTWSDHGDIPLGHAGPDGVYQRGTGNGSWFYRRNAVAGVPGRDAVPPTYKTVTIIDREAWTEIINHPAVVCDKPSNGADPKPKQQVPVKPKGSPRSDEPVVSQRCVGGALVTVTEVDGEQVESRVRNGHPDCAGTASVMEEGF